MATVFISHSSKDAAFVEKELIPFLESHGVAAWYSPDDIRTADEWEHKTLEALRSCEWFLVVMSNNSVSSDWVRAEVHWATENRKGRLIPLLLDSCNPEDLHLKLLGIQHIDFRHDRGLALRKLLNVWIPAVAGDSRTNPENPKLSKKRLFAAGAAIALLALAAAILIYSIPQRSTRNPPASPESGTGARPARGENAAPAGVSTQLGGNLRIQLRDRLEHKMSFSVVSIGRGQFVVERLFIQLHGYADCPLRNEVPVAAAASIPTSYAVHISKQYAQYDLPVLLSAGDVGVWKYAGDSSDEFSVRLSYDFYVLFIISIEAEVRSLNEGRSFRISSDRLSLLDVAHGNAGGCLRLDDWYTPENLVTPKNANYLAGVSTLARQLLTADLSYSATYLTHVPANDLERVRPELVQVERSHPDNPVIARNLQIVAAFLRGSPWELKIRSARAVHDVIDASQSRSNPRPLLRPQKPGRTFVVVRFVLSNLSSTPGYYDLRDFRLIDSQGHEQKSLGILLALSPPSVAPGRFFDEPFRVDPGQEATEISETSLVFAVNENEDRLALRYRDLAPVDFVVER